MTEQTISVVVLTLNEGDYLRRTVTALAETLPEPAEIVVVDDGSDDGSTGFLNGGAGRVRLLHTDGLGVAKGRNFGARATTGDVIVFSDAHIEPPPDWWQPLVEILSDPKAGAAGPGLADTADPDCCGFGMRFINSRLNAEWLSPETDEALPVPLLPGGFWAMRRDVFEREGGLDEAMQRWGSEDFELSLRLWMLGYEVKVAPEVEVAHLFREKAPYPIPWPAVVHNQLRTAYLHFSPARFARVVEAMRGREGFDEGYRLFEESDAPARRAELDARRVHDDDWYFWRFGEI